MKEEKDNLCNYCIYEGKDKEKKCDLKLKKEDVKNNGCLCFNTGVE